MSLPVDLKNIQTDLLANACPAIRLRIARKTGVILAQDEEDLLAEVYRDERVREVLAAQRADGWFYENFHGFSSMESAIRFLLEMGISPQADPLQKAADALYNASQERLQRGISKPGVYLETLGFSGSATIRAWILAELGREGEAAVQSRVEYALSVMRFTAGIATLDEITTLRNGKLILKPDCSWPDLYHFRLLAATHNWRTPENMKLLVQAVNTMLCLQPIPAIYGLYKHQIIAPAAFGLQMLTPELDILSDGEWMAWFQRMDLFNRLGLLKNVVLLQHYTHAYFQWLLPEKGWFMKPLRHPYFSKWGAYTGLMLEKDWRVTRRRIYDLTFRTLLMGIGAED